MRMNLLCRFGSGETSYYEATKMLGTSAKVPRVGSSSDSAASVASGRSSFVS